MANLFAALAKFKLKLYYRPAMGIFRGVLVNSFAKIFLTLLLLTGDVAVASTQDGALQEARANLNKGDVKAAVIQLKSILQQSPDNAEARLLLGEVYLRVRNGADAVKELERARELNLPKEKWVSSLAWAYLIKGDGKTLLEKIEPDPSLPATINAKVMALRGMAQMSWKDGSAIEAQNDFKSALQTDPGNIEALLGLCEMEKTRKDFKKATEYAIQATTKAPANVDAWLMLAESKRMEVELPAARDAYTKAIELRPQDPRALLGRASVLIGMGKVADAQKDVDVVRKSGLDIPMLAYTQGVIDFQLGKLDQARGNLAKVVSAMPDHVPANYLLGAIAYQKSELEQAEYYLSKVIGVMDENLQAVKLLAATRLKRGSPGEAIDLLKPWAEKNKSDAQLYAILGSAYLKNKQYEQGVAHLTHAAELAPDAASVRAELGLGRIAAGKTDQGVDDLKSAVNIDPKLYEADVTIVLAMIQQKKFDEAMVEANKLKTKRKSDPIADNLLGTVYMAKGDAVHAKENWLNALNLQPNYTPASLNLAKLAVEQNKLDEAAKAYDAILKYDPKNLSALVGLAQLSDLKKDFTAMVGFLEEARQKNPKEVMPYVMLSRYYLTIGKALKALEIANDGVGNNPENALALQNMGLAQMAANQGVNAVATFKRLVAKLPENPELHHQLAQSLFKMGDKAAATKEWDEALRLEPGYIPALLAKAELAMREKHYDEAQKTADTIKLKFPRSPLGYQLEADLSLVQKQFEKAVTGYVRAYELAPTSYLARRVFTTRQQLHQDKAAFDGLREWVAKSPQDAESWTLLASSLQAAGQIKEALQAYEQAYALQPENLVLQNNLAWLYQETGDKRALTLAEKITASPGIENKVEVLDTVGWIFLHHGKEDKGLVLLQQAALQEPKNIGVRLHLAEAFSKLGKKEEARKELDRLLKENKTFPERSRAEALLQGL